MAPALVGSTNATEASQSSTITVTRTTTEGNLLVLLVANDVGGTNSTAGPTVATVVDSNLTAWTHLAGASANGGAAGASTRIDTYYLANAPSIANVMVTFTGLTSAAATLLEISGADTPDKSTSHADTTTAWSTGTTATTTNANEMVVGAHANRGLAAITVSVGTALTQASSNVATQQIALIGTYLVVSSTGTQEMHGTTATAKNAPSVISTWYLSGTPLVAQGSGGAVSGGTSTLVDWATAQGSGGAVAGGNSTLAISLAVVAQDSGGAVSGGTSTLVDLAAAQGAGGAVSGGTSALVFLLNSTGGGVSGGVSQLTAGALNSTGGSVSGGASTLVDYLASTGGGTAAGLSTLAISLALVAQGAGGAVSGGAAVLVDYLASTGGGDSTGGMAALVFLLNSTGGSVAGGVSGIPFLLSTGGSVSGGTSALVFLLNSTGGSVAGGVSGIPGPLNSTGGATSGGTASLSGVGGGRRQRRRWPWQVGGSRLRST